MDVALFALELVADFVLILMGDSVGMIGSKGGRRWK